MKRVGFIGLGTMGKPMATNLAKAGFELAVLDLNPEATAELQGLGAKVMDGPAGVASFSEILMTMLPAPGWRRDRAATAGGAERGVRRRGSWAHQRSLRTNSRRALVHL